jgi:FAD/FMN-containing dehydrogenase
MSSDIHTAESIRWASDVAGQIHYPGDASWDEARVAWNLTVDQRPAAVAVPRSAEEVASVVREASRSGLRVSAQGTGHSAGAYGSLADTILIKTTNLRGVQVDAVARRARVMAGTLWLEIVQAAAEHGLAALAGSSPDVGVVGYTLGGGISWLSRRYGLAANSVTAIELVTANGKPRRVDAQHDPDLFWALRGGGGSFGVVTAMEFDLYPLAEVYAGTLFFELDRAGEVLAAWRDWAATVPDEVTSVGRLLQLPPLPDIPEPFRGNSFVAAEVIIQLPGREAHDMLAPLRALGPEIDTVASIPAAALSHIHMDPEHPVPGISDHTMLRELPDTAIEALVLAAGKGSGSPLLLVDIRQLGGALGRAPAAAGALSHLDGPFAMFGVGMAMNDQMATAVDTHLALVTDALAPWDAGNRYLNFVDRPGDSARFFEPHTYQRLREIKAAHDPAELFRANHPIAPAS